MLDGEGFHWPDLAGPQVRLDEDLSVDGFIKGRPSGESKERSFARWLKAKKEGRGLTLPELDAYDTSVGSKTTIGESRLNLRFDEGAPNPHRQSRFALAA